MSHFVQRTYYIDCFGDLKDEINDNVTITTELLQIVYDGVSDSFFEFLSEPSAPEITELDSILAVFTCPVDTTEQVDTQDFSDDEPSDPNVIWSSEKIETTFVPLTTTITGDKSVSGGGDLTANRTFELVNDQDTPGNDKLYGTNGSGVKGWYDQPAGGDDHISKPTGIDYWHEAISFSEAGSAGDSFLKVQNSLTSNDSTYVALVAGRVIHASVSVSKNITEDSKIVIIKNASESGNGNYAGGTPIGSDLIKNANAYYQIWTDLSGYTFAAGDRLSVYIKNDPFGLDSPVVRIYLKYD